MQVPYTTPTGSIVPLGAVDVSLHKFVNLSWHVLMPYTLLAGGIMAYSQIRLLRGQRALKRESGLPIRTQTTKT